jgi:hypothetical protein
MTSGFPSFFGGGLFILGGGVGMGVGGEASLETMRAWYLPCKEEHLL